MKSTKTRNAPRKLHLEMSTLRKLGALELSQVVGGDATLRACPRELITMQDPCLNG